MQAAVAAGCDRDTCNGDGNNQDEQQGLDTHGASFGL
jgi:hypothetical protein